MPEETPKTDLTVFNKFETQMAAIEEANAEKDFDVSTQEGIDECSAWHKRLRKGWNAVEKVRKDTKANYIRLGKEVDAEAKPIQDHFDTMAAPHKAKLDAIDAEKKRQAEAIIEAEDLAAKQAEEEKQAGIAAKEKELADREAALKVETDALHAKIAAAEKEVADAEAAKQAEIDTQVRIKAAAEKATKDAEAQAQRDAEAKEKREQGRVAGELAIKNRLAKIEADRVADVEHRKEVEIKAYDAIHGIVCEAMFAQALIDAIKENKIPNVKIVY